MRWHVLALRAAGGEAPGACREPRPRGGKRFHSSRDAPAPATRRSVGGIGILCDACCSVARCQKPELKAPVTARTSGRARRLRLVPARGAAGVARAGFHLAPPPDVQGKRVLLKPNFVEYAPERPVTTHVELIRETVRALPRARRRRSRDRRGAGSQSGYRRGVGSVPDCIASAPRRGRRSSI